MSLGLIACNGGEDGESSSKAVYGLDFEYDNTHPSEIEVTETGKLKPFTIDAADVVSECGKTFYKSDETGDIFYAEEIDSEWVAKQIGFYNEYDDGMGGYQIMAYNKRQMVSVGKYLVISSYSGLSDYWSWTRINFQQVESHDNCMVIIDEVAQDVLAVDLTNETTESIF